MTTDRADAVAETRRFNRFYTRVAGFLDEKLTHSRFTLTEARVIFELANRDAPVASGIARDLGLDPAYLARLLKKFAAAGLVERSRSDVDGRRRDLALTPAGRTAFDELQARADAEMGALLEPVPARDLPGLGRAMRAIARILGPRAAPAVALRAHRPGDVGWVISRQGALYAEEYDWDITFEALVAEIGAAFIRNFRADREGCWIAELDGERAGAVLLVRDSDETAKLRLLHVESWARGHGLGTMLVDACIAKARAAGYRRLVLWTNDVLVSARGIYQAAGFRLVEEERHHSFGKDLVGQNWELDL
ncbi:MAG: MarR family transcriptional regulator [Rhizobiales bacterium]|nr:MarR family transcriptional regulator [Hyphomicrobiales bacterium]OJU35326.1 MAG: MarR family transcriptional regulator [Rhizobiales bacterium 68-8]